MPTVYAALKFDDHLEECKHLAGEFKNLQDRFRSLARCPMWDLNAVPQLEYRPPVWRLVSVYFKASRP